MTSDDPIAFYVTWTVYGTHLQGDNRGWRRRRKGEQTPQPLLARWRSERLKHPIILLDRANRAVVESAIERHCQHRGWHMWAASARSNHVHVVVTAGGFTGKTVRDQLKANCTRELRECWKEFRERPAWTVGGDVQCINGEDELAIVVEYVNEAQDRKHLDHE
jgi:REP element-mobilizing transposase RayT